jgi:hypothetical protein
MRLLHGPQALGWYYYPVEDWPCQREHLADGRFRSTTLVFVSRMIGTGTRQRQVENGIFIAVFLHMEFLDEFLD